jgi:hypothetical protein
MSVQDYIANTPKIQVLVRKRPLTLKEKSKNEIDIVRVIDEQTLVIGEVK